MYPIMNSSASKANPALNKDNRKRNESNLAWLKRVSKKLDDGIKLVLLGGTSITDFRLRVAQSQLRHDLSPSSWSHVCIMDKPNKAFGETSIYEISLTPENGFGFPPPVNGLQKSKIKKYSDVKIFPNISVISLPLLYKDLKGSLDNFKTQRASVDSMDLITRWLGFLWGVGRNGNPVIEGIGIPSSVMIEVITNSLEFDLTPGISSTASCPEAIWQSVKWWHLYYKEQNSKSIKGYYFRSQEIFE